MLRTRHHAPLAAAVLVSAVAAVLVGCSSDAGTRTNRTAPAPSAAQADGVISDQPIGISPAGVTTRIDVPAQSTEEQYAQACLTAKEWMDAEGGDPSALIEPYLEKVQASTETGRAAFQKTWPELSTAQQAAVIIAVEAAADGGC